MALKQDNRSLAIKTALGADVLAARSFSLQEQISRLFQIEVELSSEDGGIDFDKVVGNIATIRLNVGQKDKRYFNGFVSRLVQVSNRGGYAHYRATIVPWLWFLTRTSDCRIFQQKAVPDIIEAVFKGHGFNDYQLKLSGTYKPREYCVQYRETDFNFVSRLMEQEGIYYFFQHTDGKHTLVLADSVSANKPFAGYEEITFHELEKGAAEREVITDWTMEKEVQPVATALSDFDFKKPKTSLLTSTHVTRKYGKAQFEIFDYPGEYVDHGDGERLANVRLNELQTQCEVLHGQASARGLAAGCTFKLKNHPRKDQDREYLITGVSLHADAGEFATTDGGAGSGEFFSCNFTAIDKAQQFRPARLTPKPIVQGPQTAMVVGPSGETIHCDNFGRIKVQFHWDRHAKGDDNASCWIRVSQPWGGKGWGGMFIPHVGQEVVVGFEEGDPDRPLITGRVYNPDQMPPVALPAGKTQSAIRDHGGNEIIMEGVAGSQKMRLHSPTHDSTMTLGNSITFHTLSDFVSYVKGDHHEKVEGDEKQEIVGNFEMKVGLDLTEFFAGWKHETVVGAKTELVLGSKTDVCIINLTHAVKGWFAELIHGTKIEYRNKGVKFLGKTKELHKHETMHAIIESATECIKKKKEEIEDFHQAAKTAKLASDDYALEAKEFKGSGKNYNAEYSQTMAVKANAYKEQAETIEANASSTFKVLGEIIKLG